MFSENIILNIRLFLFQKKNIEGILDSHARIEYIGSTAIPHLGGKGILDIIVGVSKSKITKAKKKLEISGYEFREKASYPERVFFRKDHSYKNGKRRIHIPLTKFNGKDWKEMIGFRNYLLKHPQSNETIYQNQERHSQKKLLAMVKNTENIKRSL